MAKNLTLHIGYPKTGTTAIQWFLHANRDALRRQSVYYPTTGQSHDHSHSRLMFALSDRHNLHEHFGETERAALFAALADEIDGSGCETVVLSSELFVVRLGDLRASKEFAPLLEGKNLRCICYFRRQDAFLESMYRQDVWSRRRFTMDAEAFLASPHTRGGDYLLVADAWSKFVGKENFFPVIYEQALNGEGCIKRLSALLGIETEGLGELEAKKNLSKSGTLGTELMRTVNTYGDLSDAERFELAMRLLHLDQSTRAMPIPKGLFSDAQRERIGQRFLESNQKLADKYIHQPLKGFWFSERLESAAEAAAGSAVPVGDVTPPR